MGGHTGRSLPGSFPPSPEGLGGNPPQVERPGLGFNLAARWRKGCCSWVTTTPACPPTLRWVSPAPWQGCLVSHGQSLPFPPGEAVRCHRGLWGPQGQPEPPMEAPLAALWEQIAGGSGFGWTVLDVPPHAAPGCGTSHSAGDGAGSMARIFSPKDPRSSPQVTSWGCHLCRAVVVELEGPRRGAEPAPPGWRAGGRHPVKPPSLLRSGLWQTPLCFTHGQCMGYGLVNSAARLGLLLKITAGL